MLVIQRGLPAANRRARELGLGMLAQMQVNSTCTTLQGGRGVGGGTRREAGNSDFVRRALLPMMPDREEFGFTVRLNADTLALDGSAAAASVCRCTAAKHCGAMLNLGFEHAACVWCSQTPMLCIASRV